jgi:hypothetical protein
VRVGADLKGMSGRYYRLAIPAVSPYHNFRKRPQAAFLPAMMVRALRCGFGLIASLDDQPSHWLVRTAMTSPAHGGRGGPASSWPAARRLLSCR